MGENTWYQWYGWLIRHIPESIKRSERSTKQKVMRLFEIKKIDNNTPMNHAAVQVYKMWQ